MEIESRAEVGDILFGCGNSWFFATHLAFAWSYSLREHQSRLKELMPPDPLRGQADLAGMVYAIFFVVAMWLTGFVTYWAIRRLISGIGRRWISIGSLVLVVGFWAEIFLELGLKEVWSWLVFMIYGLPGLAVAMVLSRPEPPAPQEA